jgi:hypothetical protein
MPLRRHSERDDSILVFEARDYANEVIEVLSLDSTESHAFNQVVIQRVFPDSCGHTASLQTKGEVGGPGQAGGQVHLESRIGRKVSQI